ncbi:MAG: universal stress protein [Bryobacteraceae bacterium]|nr:universal stress protein [Bryobacterales bacterium]NUN01255.1 universal stress protein [Bryobacteraceae bacterium]
MDLKHILIPVDFSLPVLAAAADARKLASQTGTRITLLHVRPGLGGDDPATASPASRGDWIACATGGDAVRVVQGLESILAGLSVQQYVLQGDPSEEIAEYARDTGVDLIIMPTRGVSAVRRFLLGSVTAKVLHDVDCPVWTVVHDTRIDGAATLPALGRVACAIDLGPESERILRWASNFAGRFEAALTVIHASPQLEPVLGVVHDPEWRASVGAVLRQRIGKLNADTGVGAEVKLVGGEPGKAVSAAAGELKADVLVIGRPAADRFLGRLRTNAYAIIQHSPCSVVSV